MTLFMRLPVPKIALPTLISVAVAGLLLVGAWHFLQSEGIRVSEVRDALQQSDRRLLWAGGFLSLLYIVLHAAMYREGFFAIGRRVGLWPLVRLYLKRNFISVFLPAGFLSSQAFFSEEVVKNSRVSEREMLAASGIFSFAGLLSMVLLIVPALGWLLTRQLLPAGAFEAFLMVLVLLTALGWAALNFLQRGVVFRVPARYFPLLNDYMEGLDWRQWHKKHLLRAVLWSLGVELIGIVHVWIAGWALGVPVTAGMALAGYLAVLAVLISSPFLRGAGAVEALLVLVLTRYGAGQTGAAGVAALFRLFEFWSLLVLALPVFFLRPGSVPVRLAPSILLFLLGMVNIWSGLTPTLPERAGWLRDFLPMAAVHASTALTVVTGLILLATAFQLLRGLRFAWWVSVSLTAVSLLSHLLKGVDYEEASLAALTLAALVYQRNEYTARADFRWLRRRWLPAVVVLKTVLLLGAVAIWQLDTRHFGADFSFAQAARYAFQVFCLTEPVSLHPQTAFGLQLIELLHLLGASAMLFLAYSVFRPLLPKWESESEAIEKARDLISRYGHSSLDYFKAAPDKLLFFPLNGQSFISYKNTPRYALALEDPVAPSPEAMRESIIEFDRFCRRAGLRSIYYRVPQDSAEVYRSLGKSLLMLGEEAIVHLDTFSMEGKEKKSLRNAVSKLDREGFRFVVHEAPVSGAILQQLRAVSDEWLRSLHRSELGFSQGAFDETALRQQTVLSLEDKEGKIVAFVNLIPGGNPREANFDLMRRTADAPSGAMDYLFVKMFGWLREVRGFDTCNLGLVPMSGLKQTKSLPENLLKLAYERLPAFSNYKSLRFFKEKFDPEWKARYVAYDNGLDLVNLPLVLGRAVRA